MNRAWLAVAAMVLVVTPVDAGMFDDWKGSDLMTNCVNDTDRWMAGYCFGLAAGIVDALVLYGGSTDNKIICPPDGLNAVNLAEFIAEAVMVDEVKLRELSASTILAAGAISKWRCQ